MQKSKAFRAGSRIIRISVSHSGGKYGNTTFRSERTFEHVAIFGAAAFWDVDQAQADESMQLVIEHGVNHIDVAPSYGKAEERLGPWLQRERERFFVGCKTMERTREGATAELADP